MDPGCYQLIERIQSPTIRKKNISSSTIYKSRNTWYTRGSVNELTTTSHFRRYLLYTYLPAPKDGYFMNRSCPSSGPNQALDLKRLERIQYRVLGLGQSGVGSQKDGTS